MEGKSIMNAQGRVYKLLGVDGNFYYNTIPGTLGGNSKLKIYGRLDCPSALRYLNKGYPLKAIPICRTTASQSRKVGTAHNFAHTAFSSL